MGKRDCFGAQRSCSFSVLSDHEQDRRINKNTDNSNPPKTTIVGEKTFSTQALLSLRVRLTLFKYDAISSFYSRRSNQDRVP